MWFFFLRMCACICVCRCTCVAVCMEVRAWHFCRQCLSLNLELTDPAILAVQQALVGTSCLHLPSPGLQACTTMPVIKKKDVFSFQFCDVSVCRYVHQGIGDRTWGEHQKVLDPHGVGVTDVCQSDVSAVIWAWAPWKSNKDSSATAHSPAPGPGLVREAKGLSSEPHDAWQAPSLVSHLLSPDSLRRPYNLLWRQWCHVSYVSIFSLLAFKKYMIN